MNQFILTIKRVGDWWLIHTRDNDTQWIKAPEIETALSMWIEDHGANYGLQEDIEDFEILLPVEIGNPTLKR